MKYVLVIGDGMADAPIDELGGKTPIESLSLPYFDKLAGTEMGLCQTVPRGIAPGSDTAILNIFGYDPRKYYSGRSPLEAAGMGVSLKDGDVSMRVNLCAVEKCGDDYIIHSHNGGGIEGADAENLMTALVNDSTVAEMMKKLNMTIAISRTFRHIGILGGVSEDAEFYLTEPHNILERKITQYRPDGTLAAELWALMLESYRVLDKNPINEKRRENGLLPANMIWPWGAGRGIQLPSFTEKYGENGAVISAVPLVKGIAMLAGLEYPSVVGANGDLDTNYEGKVSVALDSLKNGYDFTAIHVEAPDEMSHAGSLERKLEAIRRLDARVIKPLLERLGAFGDFRILLLSDHPTLLSTRTHDGNPVPYALYDSRHPGTPRKFCERECETGTFLTNGDMLMPHLFEK